ncbi:MAG: hypothetical protein QOI87_2631 [Bradyrhizobium sp.]|jgi:hypothetical protein|nr:hypothetical protein [Bradyrhizobium sp.]
MNGSTLAPGMPDYSDESGLIIPEQAILALMERGA